MITQTRITVDDATRKVLDELSGQLSQAPSWVAQLRDEIQDEVRDITRDALTAPTKSLSKLGEIATALQAQVVSQAEALAALAAGAEREHRLLQDLQGNYSGVLAASEQAAAAAIQQRDDVHAMGEALQVANRQQEERAAQFAEALQGTHALLRELQTVQMSQRDALQSILQRVEQMSKPWWKKLF
ncbi:hypothetical protein [Trinickia soli]|uniref:hypothetical protein n=1 Tax=Trinickia soli TaxID=380675 RepID=UPI003FA39058